MKYIDIHGHMNFAAYDADREDVIKRAAEAGVAMITVGTDLESSRAAIRLAESHENMWATVGVHPTCASEHSFDEGELGSMAKHPKVVAIGECGLDYFHSGQESAQDQREMFYRHISLANTVKKPLMLHVRNGKDGTNAYEEAVSILRERANVRANFHFFAGTVADLNSIVAIDGTVSFTGVLSFARDYDEVVRTAPLDRIMSETDCPYVAPLPHRGQRNEPSYVTGVVKKIAEIRGEDEGAVASAMMQNARKFFGI